MQLFTCIVSPSTLFATIDKYLYMSLHDSTIPLKNPVYIFLQCSIPYPAYFFSNDAGDDDDDDGKVKIHRVKSKAASLKSFFLQKEGKVMKRMRLTCMSFSRPVPKTLQRKNI